MDDPGAARQSGTMMASAYSNFRRQTEAYQGVEEAFGRVKELYQEASEHTGLRRDSNHPDDRIALAIEFAELQKELSCATRKFTEACKEFDEIRKKNFSATH